MSSFDDRLAALEEHVVAPKPTTPEEFLTMAEEALADGDEETALAWLQHAKIRRCLAELQGSLDELEEDDDA